MAQLSGLTNNEKLRGSKKPEPDDIDVDEIPLPQKRTFYERVYEMAEKFAENSLGQFVIERADRILKVVEDTAKWSLPQEKTENNLERPMSWVPFLMLIVTLRVLRFWLTVGAMMIGNGPVTPANTVYFIQTRRRKLRALRVHGAKAIRRRAAETRMEASNGSAADKSIVDKLRNLLSIAICRPGQQREQAKSVFIKQDSGFVVGSSNDRQSSKRPRDDSLNDHNLTIDQMLSKYANEDSDDDSDFVPRPEEETNDDSSSASDSDDASDASSDEDSNAEASAKEKTPRKQTSDGVEIVENGTGKRCAMPKPMQEIKTEMHSDADSMNDESTPGKDKENKKQMGNGVEKQQNQQSQPTAKKTTAASAASNTNNNNKTALTNGMSEKQQTAAAKTTANGTDSTGMPKQSLALNTTANAGSPTDFNACFAKLINDDTTNDTTTSTPTSNFETELYDNFPISEQSNLLTEDQQQQPQQPIYAKHQPFYHNQRYRGKNRRY